MKTIVTIIVTAIVTAIITWIAADVDRGVRTGIDRLWMVSAIKAPGRMAINDIQADINAGRYELAKQKLDALATTWQRFSSGPDSCTGLGIGDIMVTFGKLDGAVQVTNVVPAGAADLSLPVVH